MQPLDETSDYWYQKYLIEEYRQYIHTHQMTEYERRLLRNWVLSGHSVYQSPGSRYLPDVYPEPSFLDTYREDRYLQNAMKGLSFEEKRRYLMNYLGWDEG